MGSVARIGWGAHVCGSCSKSISLTSTAVKTFKSRSTRTWTCVLDNTVVDGEDMTFNLRATVINIHISYRVLIRYFAFSKILKYILVLGLFLISSCDSFCKLHFYARS